ncbi:MAG: TniQ family protein [Paracoccaceae bacterium]
MSQQLSRRGGRSQARSLQRSFQRKKGKRTQIGGHVMTDSAISRSQLRVCPACLREDIGPTLDGSTAFRIYNRLFWALQAAHCCPKHHLVAGWTA